MSKIDGNIDPLTDAAVRQTSWRTATIILITFPYLEPFKATKHHVIGYKLVLIVPRIHVKKFQEKQKQKTHLMKNNS